MNRPSIARIIDPPVVIGFGGCSSPFGSYILIEAMKSLKKDDIAYQPLEWPDELEAEGAGHVQGVGHWCAGYERQRRKRWRVERKG